MADYDRRFNIRESRSSASRSAHPMAITAEQLRKQLRFLKYYFMFVDVDTAVEVFRSRQDERPVAVLTFDDGIMRTSSMRARFVNQSKCRSVSLSGTR